LGQDILSLPISDDISMDKSFGHRYFSIKELEEASKMDDLVKEILGDTVCFRGNVPSSLLYAGTPQQVTDYVKELIDVVGKGGGLMVDCGIWFDEAKHENVKAMVDFTKKYGAYK
jgi:uroporphyrinogen-III decarboxylase